MKLFDKNVYYWKYAQCLRYFIIIIIIIIII